MCFTVLLPQPTHSGFDHKVASLTLRPKPSGTKIILRRTNLQPCFPLLVRHVPHDLYRSRSLDLSERRVLITVWIFVKKSM